MKQDTVAENAVGRKRKGRAGYPGKDAAVISHAESLAGIERFSSVTGQRRAADTAMRGLLKNARFTGALLGVLVRELEGETLDSFCRNTGADVETGNSLAGMATEIGSTYTRDIRLDVIFEHQGDSGLLLRINTEAQTAQKTYSERNQQSYSLAARAVYYASLAMATQLRSKEEYHKIRKVYSIWFCYDYPIAEMREPVIRYSMHPDAAYTYADGTPLLASKRKHDSGDLMGIIFVSVKDVERIYRDSSLLHSGKYDAEMITVLYHLLSEKTDSTERKKFYYDRGIIKPGSEEESKVSELEELREITEEMKRALRWEQEMRGEIIEEMVEELLEERAEKLAEERAEKLAEERAEKLAEERAEKLAEERAEKLAEEMKEKMKEEINEEKQRTVEKTKREAQESANQAIVKMAVSMGARYGCDLPGQLSMIAEALNIGTEEAGQLHRVYSNV